MVGSPIWLYESNSKDGWWIYGTRSSGPLEDAYTKRVSYVPPKPKVKPTQPDVQQQVAVPPSVTVAAAPNIPQVLRSIHCPQIPQFLHPVPILKLVVPVNKKEEDDDETEEDEELAVENEKPADEVEIVVGDKKYVVNLVSMIQRPADVVGNSTRYDRAVKRIVLAAPDIRGLNLKGIDGVFFARRKS
jgi:hypothetical protein